MNKVSEYKFAPDGTFLGVKDPAPNATNLREQSHTNISNRGGEGYIENLASEIHKPSVDNPQLIYNPSTGFHDNPQNPQNLQETTVDENLYRQISWDIDQFIDAVGNMPFTSDQIDRQFSYVTSVQKKYRWTILERKVPNELEKVATGKYRKVQTKLEPINWQEADLEDLLKLNYPLGMEKIIKTYKGTILVCAGVSHAGKTGIAYDFILKNMAHKMGVHLFSSSDMDEVEIKERFSKSGILIPNPAPFKVWEMPVNPVDLVQPDAINVLDYVDLNSDLYKMGEVLDKIQSKLGRGFAWVNIQKKAGQELGMGGVFSIKRSKIYLSLDTVQEGGELLHQLTIRKSRGRMTPASPVGRYYKFKLIDGIRTHIVEEG